MAEARQDFLQRGVRISFVSVQHERPALRSHRAASAARGVLEAHQRRRRWGVRYSAFGQPSFCAVLEGRCRLTVDGHRPLTLEAGDFVLLPATPGFTMSGFEPVRLDASTRR